MELLVSHVILSVVVGVTGLCVGWWLHGRLPDSQSLAGQHDEGLIRELMSRLHSLSVRVAADVNEHSTTVRAVDRGLEQTRDQCASVVGELVDRLIAANRNVQSKLAETEGKLDELSHKMEHHASEARTDVLTGLANRRAFQEESVRIQSDTRETDQTFSLVMIDIDRFKQVNDVHGHPFGDEVLRGVGEILLDNFRGRDVATRYGGEEFAILMPATSVAEARRAAEAVRECIARTRFAYSGKSLSLTVSLGVAEIRTGECMPDLLKRADQAMYAAKHSGRNCVFWHDGTLSHPLRSPQTRTVEETPDRVNLTLSDAPAEATRTSAMTGFQVEESGATPEPPQPDLSDQVNSKGGGTLQVGDVDMEALSNMGSKTMFCQNVHRRIAEYNRGGAPFSAILLQVDKGDGFARLHGEPAWEMTMAVVAQAIRSRVRDMDFVARYSDVIFGMVMPEADIRNAICIAERLRKMVHQTTVQLDGKSLQFTVSLGVVEVEEGDVMASLVERARGQLQDAQENGGNRTGFAANALVAS